ncbi:MAG: D-hexose-6-phosphate mutarotase, partial [Congregibacter sp.]|nr:D-hexose-6-phosphate mutarotase [Congregibacter sp.]
PVLWVSKDAIYAQGTSVRGGIPICWPWFGVQENAAMAAHGFVRNRFWQLRSTQQSDAGTTEVLLSLEDDERSRLLWPYRFELQLKVSVGATLTLALTMTNRAVTPVEISAALHSYFHVGDIAATSVQGLENTEYIDALQSFQRFKHAGDVRFDAELDRIYPQTSAPETIIDEALQRKICLRKQGSNSTVVWNPWVNKSSRMRDFEAEGYRRMLCVETGNIADDALTLQPGRTHSLCVDIGVEKFASDDNA